MLMSGDNLGSDWQLASWPVGPWRALTTTRTGGVSKGVYQGLNLAAHVGDAREAVARNRRLLSARVGRPRIQWLDQVHGVGCLQVDMSTATAVPEADAAWTTDSNVALAVLTADCLPVVFAHRDGGVIGVAHAGWRGLVSGVLTNTVYALPGEPGDYLAWIGPGIGMDAYQVGEEVAAAVSAMSHVGAEANAHLHRGKGHDATQSEKYQLDLAGLAAAQLGNLGVAQVYCDRVCTAGDPRFYSYRRDGATGRMATVVWLSPG